MGRDGAGVFHDTSLPFFVGNDLAVPSAGMLFRIAFSVGLRAIVVRVEVTRFR